MYICVLFYELSDQLWIKDNIKRDPNYFVHECWEVQDIIEDHCEIVKEKKGIDGEFVRTIIEIEKIELEENEKNRFGKNGEIEWDKNVEQGIGCLIFLYDAFVYNEGEGEWDNITITPFVNIFLLEIKNGSFVQLAGTFELYNLGISTIRDGGKYEVGENGFSERGIKFGNTGIDPSNITTKKLYNSIGFGNVYKKKRWLHRYC